MSDKILIVDPLDGPRAALERYLERDAALGGRCEVRARPAEAYSGAMLVLGGAGAGGDLARPCRLGAVLDRALSLGRRAVHQQSLSPVVIGPYVLDPAVGALSKDGTKFIRLTEKERDILLILAAAGGQAIARDDLLARVWAYADGVETHTLETHIYRLRQKIERDPASPRWLLTTGDGYSLQQDEETG